MHRTMLAASPVPAAVAGNAIAASLVTELANAGHITAQFNFDYGSGGTSATYWLQTTLDGGATWIDIACVQFTTADAVKIVNIDAGGYVAPGYTPGDGTLAVGSVVDGIMGDRLRIKQTIVGSYANSTISVDVVDKAGVGGPKTVTQAGAPAALGQAAASASMPVVIASDQSAVAVAPAAAETHLGEVGGRLVSVTASFTREANATAYTAGDVVSATASPATFMSFTNLARVNGGSGYIVGARASHELKSVTPRLRIHLFNAKDATIAGDNLPYKHLYAEVSKRLGSFDLPALGTGADATNSDESRVSDFTMRVPFIAAAGSRTIYAVIETLDAWTPGYAKGVSLTLIADQN